MSDRPKRCWYSSPWLIPLWIVSIVILLVTLSDIGAAWYNSRHPERIHNLEE
jgi:hypothetical protein